MVSILNVLILHECTLRKNEVKILILTDFSAFMSHLGFIFLDLPSKTMQSGFFGVFSVLLFKTEVLLKFDF